MARPKPDLPDARVLKQLIDDSGCLAVKVTPGARSEGLTVDRGKVLAKVRAKPKDGEANTAVIKLIAKALGIAPSQIALLRGANARDKRLRIDL